MSILHLVSQSGKRMVQGGTRRVQGGIAVAIATLCGIGSGGCSDGTSMSDCASVTVSNDEELQAALAAACPEKNILMKNGVYSTPVMVDTGVHLTGESPDGVVLTGETQDGVEVQPTLTVEQGATKVTLESFTLAGSPGTALLLEDGAEVEAKDLSIQSPMLYGIFASAGTALTLEDSTIIDSGGPGVWATCGQENCCEPGASRPSVTLRNTTVEGAHLAGLSFFGSDVTLEGVAVTGTLPGPQGTSYTGQGGGGLTVASCSDVKQGRALRIENSWTYGALFDASTGVLGDEAAPQGDVTIEGSGEVGFWAQNPPAGDPSQPWFQLANAVLSNNKGVGLGIGGGGNPGDERGAIICKVRIHGVPGKTLPTWKNGGPGQEVVGDGLFWKEMANVMELDVSVDGAERQAVLIDGPVPQPQFTPAFSLANNNKNTVLQQSVTAGQELVDVKELETETGALLAGARNLNVPSIVE